MQNTSEKLDYRYCCASHPSHRKESFSRLNWKVGQNRKNMIAISASSAVRTKKSRFASKLRIVSFFCNRQGGRVTPGPLPCMRHWGPSQRLSAWGTQKHRNHLRDLQRWRYCGDWTSPGIKPQTFHTDSLCG